MNPQQPFEPPPVHHVHVPHKEPLPPQPHFIDPDVLKAEKERDDKLAKAAGTHPLMNLFLVLIGALPMGYVTVHVLRSEIGWMAIVPPVILVLLIPANIMATIGGT
jgi:hypothetical protein